MVNIKRIGKWVGGFALALAVSLALLGWYGLHALNAHNIRVTPAVVERFHEHFNTGEFDKICDEAIGCSETVRNDWRSVLQEVADRAGKFKEVKGSEIKAYIEPLEVRADYICSFEKTDVKEIFILKPSGDGRVRILSYQTVTKPTLPADQQEFRF
jgi:hypothetical protein